MKYVCLVHQADYWHDEKMAKQKVRLALHTCMTLQKEQKKKNKKKKSLKPGCARANQRSVV